MTIWNGASHCDPVTPPFTGALRAAPFPGYGGWLKPTTALRGAVVYCFGLANTSWNRLKLADVSVTLPATQAITGYADSSNPIAPFYQASLMANLLNDGWAIFQMQLPEVGRNFLSPNGIPSIPAMALQNDAASDPTHGGNYVNAVQRTIEHTVRGIKSELGECPIVFVGGSHGGWTVLIATAYLGGRLAAAAPMVPATRWGVANTAFSSPADYQNIDMSGMDIPETYFNNLPSALPVLVGYGTNDEAIGWSQTTIDPSSVGVDVSTLTGTQSLTVTDATQLVTGPAVIVQTSAGEATVHFGSISGNQLLNCTTTFGSGTISSGAIVIQSSVNRLITVAQAAGKTGVVRNASASTHGLDMLTCGLYFPLAGPTALSALGTLTLDSQIGGAGFTSGQTQIRDDTGTWHTVSFTGTGTTTVNGQTVSTLTGCTYSGSTAATVSLGAPVVSSGSPQSILWWLSQNVDPNCPKVF